MTRRAPPPEPVLPEVAAALWKKLSSRQVRFGFGAWKRLRSPSWIFGLGFIGLPRGSIVVPFGGVTLGAEFSFSNSYYPLIIVVLVVVVYFGIRRNPVL